MKGKFFLQVYQKKCSKIKSFNIIKSLIIFLNKIWLLEMYITTEKNRVFQSIINGTKQTDIEETAENLGFGCSKKTSNWRGKCNYMNSCINPASLA
jgi:hypothetical protein